MTRPRPQRTTGPLEVGEKAADALARGAGELGKVGLVHADRDPVAVLQRRLLGDQLGEHSGDPARDGLEGLARDALVGLPQAPHQRRDELHRDLRMAGEQRPHVGAGQRQQLAVVERLDAGRAHLAVEHRQLAEDVAGAEVGERDRPPVGVLAGDPEAAAADDVAGVGVVALVKDAGAAGKGARHGDPREAVQLVAL